MESTVAMVIRSCGVDALCEMAAMAALMDVIGGKCRWSTSEQVQRVLDDLADEEAGRLATVVAADEGSYVLAAQHFGFDGLSVFERDADNTSDLHAQFEQRIIGLMRGVLMADGGIGSKGLMSWALQAVSILDAPGLQGPLFETRWKDATGMGRAEWIGKAQALVEEADMEKTVKKAPPSIVRGPTL